MRKIFASLFIVIGLNYMLTPPTGAGLQEGQDAYKRGDYETALNEIRPLAEGGNAEAQELLGTMYAYGRGVEQDYKQAIYWYQKAAEQGLPEAFNSLGFMYESGKGVPKDYKEAERYFRLACPTCDVPDAEMMEWINEGSKKSIEVDLDADGKLEVVKEIWGGGVSSKPLTIEVYKDEKLIASINPNKFGIQSNYRIVNLDDDPKREIVIWSGLWDPRLPGEDAVTEEDYEGHSSPHRYVFVTYKLIRGKYYPWNYYTTKKKYEPYFSWEGKEFPE